MENNNEWVRYSEQQPTEAGLYEWRVPSSEIDGMTLIVIENMRWRSAGFDTVLSPRFDYWNGYRLTVDCDVYWRPVSENGASHYCVSIEGLEISSCSHCGEVPKIMTYRRHKDGYLSISAQPWLLNRFDFECCEWGSTPRMSDPFELERIRRATRNKAQT